MYDLNQCRCIAREVARAGGFVSKAVASLKARYQGFERLQPETISAMLDKPFFQRLRQEQTELLAKAQAAVELEAEKARWRAAAPDKNPARAAVADVIERLQTAGIHRHDNRSMTVLLDYLEFQNRL